MDWIETFSLVTRFSPSVLAEDKFDTLAATGKAADRAVCEQQTDRGVAF
jgi:hypothetical protein